MAFARVEAGGEEDRQASAEERPALVAAQSEQKKELKALEARSKEIDEEIRSCSCSCRTSPRRRSRGATDEDNVEIKRWGEPRSFDFDPRSHSELGEAHGWIDVVRGARLAGSRNYVLLGDMSLLEHAVMRFAFDSMVARGFTPLSVPTLVRSETMVGTGYFPAAGSGSSL